VTAARCLADTGTNAAAYATFIVLGAICRLNAIQFHDLLRAQA
jgi:hypothetical protein